MPQFRGDFGKMRFETEDLFVDAAGRQGAHPLGLPARDEARAGGWRGLDILHVEGGRVTRKLTYAKAKIPLIE